MRNERRILAVVPARGGSKGVATKNLRPVLGVPLVVRAGQIAAELDWVDRAVCSTDHGGITRAAHDAGLETPFFRPPELSGDRVGDLEVLTHALRETEADDGTRYDVVVMLQPTSPLRRPEHVTATVDRLIADDLDAVWTVSPTDPKSHPLKQLVLDSEGRMQLFDERGADIVARQQLAPVYHRNGAAYAITRDCLLEQGSILGERAAAVVIDEPMCSIDTVEDFLTCEQVLRDRIAAGEAPPPAPRPDKLTFVVDIDGVLAGITQGNDYTKSQPLRDHIEMVNALAEAGHRIVLFTARGSATGRDWSEHTRKQMDSWGVRYDDLRLGKPSADYYIDDRLVSLHDATALAGVASSGRISPETQKGISPENPNGISPETNTEANGGSREPSGDA